MWYKYFKCRTIFESLFESNTFVYTLDIIPSFNASDTNTQPNNSHNIIIKLMKMAITFDSLINI